MVTQACNLSCQGCTNYSDLPVKAFELCVQKTCSLVRYITTVLSKKYKIALAK
jgi:hypothetical protein